MAFRIAILIAIALVAAFFVSTPIGREWMLRRFDDLRSLLP